MFSMRAYLLQGQVWGGCVLEIEIFWALWNGIKPVGECHLGPKKLEISRSQPPPTCQSNGNARIQNIMHRAV